MTHRQHMAILFSIFIGCGLLSARAQHAPPSQASIEKKLPDGTHLTIPESWFSSPNAVSLSNTKERPLDYPEQWREYEPDGLFAPIALNTVISFPVDALNLAALTEDDAFLRVRIPPTETYEDNAVAEIRYYFDDGTVRYAYHYYAGGETEYEPFIPSEIIVIPGADLAYFLENGSEAIRTKTLTISIQPVGLREYFSNGDTE